MIITRTSINGRLTDSLNQSDAGKPGVSLEIRMLKSIQRLNGTFSSLKDQKSETCGPYSLLKIAQSLETKSEYDLSEDIMAKLSGTTISRDEYELSRKLKGKSEDELDDRTREVFYPLEMKFSDREEELGTSAVGVLEAARKVLGNQYSAKPFFAARNNEVNLTSEAFRKVGELIWENLQKTDLNIILNLQVDLTCSNAFLKTPVDLFEFLSREECMELDDWSVGHFVVLAGMIKKYSESGHEFYYVLQDNYKSRGMSGYIFQPAESLRNALIRNDGKEGGFIVIYHASRQDIGKDLESCLTPGIWDNGTPYRAD